MLEIGGDLDLVEEPLAADDGRQLGPQHFHRDLAIVLDVVREVHRCHAAGAHFPLDAVAVGEGGLEALKELSHQDSIMERGTWLSQRPRSG